MFKKYNSAPYLFNLVKKFRFMSFSSLFRILVMVIMVLVSYPHLNTGGN